jgi:N-acyl-D-aspartate/D-glutamate deacylase
VLGRYVRERKVVTLEEAVRKMTSQAADALGLRGHGRLQPGGRGNAVVFDPAAVADRATFEDPAQYPVGIRDVLVAGQPVLRAGESTGAAPGGLVA